ncbi:MAG TPA: CPBP family intramembrane glutamic endopeptidase [Polyangiaceae bacterium]|nr:CPBP family intramembrane glutamic endopeptidase [Polyangiaceae bacterium]
MTAAFVSSAVLASVALVAARLETRDVRARLRLAPTRASAAGLVATIVGMAGLSLASGAAVDLLGGRGRGAMGAVAHALEQPTPGRLLMAIATIAIAPGAAEETFFRGLVQTSLTSRWGRWPSIPITALGFGLMHFDLIQGLVAFIAGLFLGWVADRFGGIRPSMAAHACNNSAFVVLASFGSAAEGTRGGDLAAIAAGLVSWIGATALIRSRFAVRESTPSLRE